MTLNAKPRKTSKPTVTKLCLHCHQVRKLGEFYSNRDWIDQAGKDVWCKKCVSQIKTKDDMRKYFWENNRDWDDRIWKGAMKKAEQQAAKNAVYQKSSEDRQQIILEALTCQQIPTVMQIHYRYVDNSKDINTNSYEEAKEEGKIIEIAPDPNVKTFSHEFNGNFKPSEVEYLENFYNGLMEDFNLSDVSLRDNAKKLAKASLLADKVQNDYMAGKCALQDVKDAMSQYDLLMKTGNFAACKRKPDEKGGLNNWAETTMYCETHGHPCVRKIEWDKDSVDVVLDGLYHIVEALRGDEEVEPA